MKKSFRKLATKFHPDKNDGDTFFVSRFKEIQEAYEVLSNPTRKVEYDKKLDDFLNLKSNSTFEKKTYEPKRESKKGKTEKEKPIKKNNVSKKMLLFISSVYNSVLFS
ncbi:DnaJ domain-containing protein [Polaribacter litorisediminis]|uniref:J domain-containing protein n=1 Tax=Polaribacter litorisediminis TaxID=1908341 RepID=UPI001CBCD9CE|nr:DnaJ domain-containing protein [Polaribacter litorisediminis]UAN00018.1 DnaJ domain-containing protein [Polaribacter litorisediminis]